MVADFKVTAKQPANTSGGARFPRNAAVNLPSRFARTTACCRRPQFFHIVLEDRHGIAIRASGRIARYYFREHRAARRTGLVPPATVRSSSPSPDGGAP